MYHALYFAHLPVHNLLVGGLLWGSLGVERHQDIRGEPLLVVDPVDNLGHNLNGNVVVTPHVLMLEPVLARSNCKKKG